MSSRSQRGRNVRKQNNPMRWLYIGLGAITVLAVIAIAVTAVAPPAVAPTVPAATSASGSSERLPLSSFQAKGSADAPVTVVEYADFQCPACGYFATTLAADIDKAYIETGKVRFVYHEFPLPQHQNAVPAAEAARCAADQNAFWPMHDLLFAKQQEWENLGQPQATFANYAASLKLDKAAFESCLSSGKHRQAILAAERDADTARISSTPTFEVNGKRVGMNDLKATIDAALAGK